MNINALQDMLGQSKYTVAFTGAGISAESGVPTYRGAGGMWNVYDPDKYANIDYFYQDPSYYWQFFRDVRYPSLHQAQPNTAHNALVSLERLSLLHTVITQNIDGFHQTAGSQKVLELHGSTRVYTCMQCKEQFSMHQVFEFLESKLPPTCPKCQGLIRPGTVMFGEALPMQVLHKAEEAALQADLFMCIGSSLVVQPAASFPVVAKQSGAWLVIVNKDPTPLDDMADLVFHQSASEVLVPLVQAKDMSQ
ncbi:MAG: NAD-dependent deacylase [Desulfovermiculus sp.]|nr:NAD-dependent deacylase [Desulfovermiculus sp.]